MPDEKLPDLSEWTNLDSPEVREYFRRLVVRMDQSRFSAADDDAELLMAAIRAELAARKAQDK